MMTEYELNQIPVANQRLTIGFVQRILEQEWINVANGYANFELQQLCCALLEAYENNDVDGVLELTLELGRWLARFTSVEMRLTWTAHWQPENYGPTPPKPNPY